MELQALPSRIGQVRRIVSAQLRYWHMDPLIDRAALGVTELLSNVHRHARPDKSCTVELELLPDRLTVSVRDHDPRLPVPADAKETTAATPLATCGRGLAMVAAVSESWGARPDGENGKVVWFTLPAPATARSHPSGSLRGAVRSTPAPAATRAAVPTRAAAPTEAAVPAGAVLPAGPTGSGPCVTPAAPVPASAAPLTRPAPPPLRRTAAPAVSTAPAAASTVTAPVGAPAPAAGSAPAPTGTAAPARSAVPS
ncbi:ATPase [Streptomyces hygroscopicus subsp. limoneus]|nr:ATPase [Streptomyces hygroscopicus subsp. limoneus]